MDRVEDFIMSSIYGSPVSFNRHDHLELKTAMQSFLEVDLSKKEKLEIPACLFFDIFIKIGTYDKAVLPITSCTNPHTRRLVRGILADFMNSSYYRAFGFCYDKTASGDYYYGLPGIILNANKELLLMMTIEVTCTYIDTNIVAVPSRLICHISPKVFENPDKLIEKTIIKKVIPFCSTKHLDDQAFRYRDVLRNLAGTSIKVVIDDCSNFVAKPVAPDPSVDIQKELNDIISDSITSYISK